MNFFAHFQGSKRTSGHWLSDFEYLPNLCPWQLFKKGYPSRHFCQFCHTFSNPHNLGLERTFRTFSVLEMIVLSLAILWAQKYFDVGLICACGGCSNRATVKAFWPILPHLFSNPHNCGREWTFWTFPVLKMIVLSLAIRLA